MKNSVRNIFFCILSSIFLVISFPNFFAIGGNIWLFTPLQTKFLTGFAWFGFVPWFFAIQNKPRPFYLEDKQQIKKGRGKSKVKVFLFSYLTGVIFWFGVIYWVAHVTLIGMFLLVLYLALYFGIFGLIFSISNLQSPISNLLFIPSCWVLLEYVRSYLLTGFGWALLGYSQYLNLPIIQIADITGTWGVSFLVVMVNVAIWQLFLEVRQRARDERRGTRDEGRKDRIVHRPSEAVVLRPSYILCFMFCFLSVIGYGFYKLNSSLLTHHSSLIKISIIQGNIPQELKWDYVYADFIISKYLELTKEAAIKDNPDLIIWPEASFPEVLGSLDENINFSALQDVIRDIETPLLMGAVILENDNYLNSALLISKQGEILKRYDKLHLVPFGEYIPLKRLLGFLETVVPIGNFSAGKEYTIFKIQFNADSRGLHADTRPVESQRDLYGARRLSQEENLRESALNNFAVLICFEDIFPELSRQFTKRGANFLVNITNDAWFGKTSAPYQHLSASVFRAVENRRPIIRNANTGVSCFIDTKGKAKLLSDNAGQNIFISGFKTQEIRPNSSLSFYTRFGNIFVVVCIIIVLISAITQRRLKSIQ